MADFGTRLRELRKVRGLRQKDLADAFDIAQTTIANYEKKLRFPHERMLGKLADYFGVSLDYLMGRTDLKQEAERQPPAPESRGTPGQRSAHARSLTERAARYLEVLRQDGVGPAGGLIEMFSRGGMSLKEIYLDVLEPALKEAGRLWETSELSVAEEHLISNATQHIMSRIFPESPRAGQAHGERRALVLAPSGEQHLIGARMVADFLQLDGWKVQFPGGNLAVRHVIEMLEERLPSLLAVSVTLDINVAEAADIIDAVRARGSLYATRILAGGQALQARPGLWQKIGADATGGNAEEAAAEASRLV